MTIRQLTSALILSCCLLSCKHSHTSLLLNTADVDLDSIQRRNTLRIVTDYNTVNYFMCKDVAVGLQYELCNEYAKHIGAKLEITVSNNHEHNVDLLNSGKVDIIATTLIADSVNEKRIAFTQPYAQSKIVLVQRTDEKCVRADSLAALAGDTVSFLANSFYEDIINNINDTASFAAIEPDPIEHYDVEQIIQLVAEHEVSKAIALENIARVNKWYYPNLDVSVPLSANTNLAWGVRLNATALRADIDQWLSDFRKTQRFKRIYRKYIIDPREHHSTVQRTSAETYNNAFEAIIKRYTTDERYNYLLISSIIYQESHFNPDAVSWAGACGLMQLMPETALRFGVDDISQPEQNIKAGIKYIMWLDARLVKYVPNSQERIKFTLAAYNVGLGHIMDAIRLAEKHGMQTNKWDSNVEIALLQKGNAQYYSDPVVKHGYCRGTETINYVRNIIDRYNNYKRTIKR